MFVTKRVRGRHDRQCRQYDLHEYSELLEASCCSSALIITRGKDDPVGYEFVSCPLTLLAFMPLMLLYHIVTPFSSASAK